MRRWQLILFSMMASLLLSSCSRPPILVLVNNSGHAIEILFVSRDGTTNEAAALRSPWERWFGLPVRIGSNRARALGTAQFAGIWFVQLRSRDCRLSFEIPVEVGEQYLNNAWPRMPHDEIGPVDPTVQLEADQTLHLVPLGSRHAWDVETVDTLQPAGFPLAPTERDCAASR